MAAPLMICAAAAVMAVCALIYIITLFFSSLFFPKSLKSATDDSFSFLSRKRDDSPIHQLSYNFTQFDIVGDFSDHYYEYKGSVPHRPARSFWMKTIQAEWKILQHSLPETIFVRACESRMDLLRAAIVGADGTPYHDGLFFFDIMFPSSYPLVPPKVHYHSGGLGLNPNLYSCGRVCLSLLGTWRGKNTELWIPHKSTMLQVLVSLQALVFNSKPLFNEPMVLFRGIFRQKRLKWYNEEVFVLSLRTMMYTLKNPPKKFEDLVTSHFRIRALDILTACKMYKKGVEIGSDVKWIIREAKEVKSNNSRQFYTSLVPVANMLVEALIKNGSTECQHFRGKF